MATFNEIKKFTEYSISEPSLSSHLMKIALQNSILSEVMIHTMSRVVAALRSGSMASSRILKKVAWSSMPYTLSRNIMMEALCVGISPGGKLTAGGDELSAS